MECPKCGNDRKMTHHHILPKCHYRGSKQTIELCRECHDEIETIILSLEGRDRKGRRNRLPEFFYRNLINFFLKQA